MHKRGEVQLKINWKVRLKNPTFYLTMVPALLLVAQIVLNWIGVDVAADVIEAEVSKFINAVFVVLALLGIVADPTTKGVSDSERAKQYKKPRGNL
jgi:phi LC3 family holin